MKEIIEIYTKSKSFDNIREIMKELTKIRTKCNTTSFEVIARYIYTESNEKNILIELQVSTKWCRDNNIDDFIDIVAYEFSGNLESYVADIELDRVSFNGNWKTAIKQMKQLAINVSKQTN